MKKIGVDNTNFTNN